MTEKRPKFCHVGVPAIYKLELAAKAINKAFDSYGTYLVGSCLERPDFRDIDIVNIMPDSEFEKLFPNAERNWEFDERWLLLTISISEYLKTICDHLVDFKFQPQSWANEHHPGTRHPIGFNLVRDH